jgi:benzodiazapine receptor
MKRSGTRRHWAALVVFLVLSYAVADVGLLATIPNILGWYAEADKPAWTPPNLLFGPVWTVLYALIAVAAWLVWRTGAPGRRPAMIAYGVQLGLNLV